MSSMLGHATFTHLPLPKPLFFSSSTEDGPDNTAIIQITSPARTLDLLWLTLLLSPAINFNQILCTLLYSCLKPSKVLLLLGKPLPVILTLVSIASFPPFPSPHVFLGSKGQLWHHWAIYPSYHGLQTHLKHMRNPCNQNWCCLKYDHPCTGPLCLINPCTAGNKPIPMAAAVRRSSNPLWKKAKIQLWALLAGDERRNTWNGIYGLDKQVFGYFS